MFRDDMAIAKASWEAMLVRLEEAVLAATDPRAKIERIVVEWDVIIAKRKGSPSGRELRRVLTELLELNLWIR
jgi:hypothetical protein